MTTEQPGIVIVRIAVVAAITIVVVSAVAILF
jgi:hypothetical protein